MRKVYILQVISLYGTLTNAVKIGDKKGIIEIRRKKSVLNKYGFTSDA